MTHCTIAIALALASALLLLASVFAAGPVDRVVQLGGRLPVHALIGFLAGLAMIQFDLVEGSGFVASPSRGCALPALPPPSCWRAGTAGACAGSPMSASPSNSAIIYVVTMQSMLGTAGFFLAAALILAVLAFVIIRIEKRMTTRPAAEGAAA